MALTITNLVRNKIGNKWEMTGLIAFDSSYPTGGELISAVDLGLAYMEVLNVNPRSGYIFDGVVATGGATANVIAYTSGGFTPAGTNSVPTFTGSALTAHTHTLFLNNAEVSDGATTRVNAGTNLLGANTGADISVAGVADVSGHGGIVQITGGTPAGTVTAPNFTGTAVVAATLAQVANATNLATLTGVVFSVLGV